jgi:hypothetical protein
LKEQFPAQRARQESAPAPLGVDICAPSTYGHVDSAVNKKASEAATADNVTSGSDNESEERGGHERWRNLGY